MRKRVVQTAANQSQTSSRRASRSVTRAGLGAARDNGTDWTRTTTASAIGFFNITFSVQGKSSDLSVTWPLHWKIGRAARQTHIVTDWLEFISWLTVITTAAAELRQQTSLRTWAATVRLLYFFAQSVFFFRRKVTFIILKIMSLLQDWFVNGWVRGMLKFRRGKTPPSFSAVCTVTSLHKLCQSGSSRKNSNIV